jgi:hypothetical protein
MEILSGTPQCSILGLLPFIIFIMILLNHVKMALICLCLLMTVSYINTILMQRIIKLGVCQIPVHIRLPLDLVLSGSIQSYRIGACLIQICAPKNRIMLTKQNTIQKVKILNMLFICRALLLSNSVIHHCRICDRKPAVQVQLLKQ